ncbi:MAG TPA: hypothetical protein VL547_09925, partial [Dinghuibacter sp.]|uniref:hypothetical protein n=1 Tax=Dinghuibacter sp. TaxID=2024697 RepID=UPI002C908EDE
SESRQNAKSSAVSTTPKKKSPKHKAAGRRLFLCEKDERYRPLKILRHFITEKGAVFYHPFSILGSILKSPGMKSSISPEYGFITRLMERFFRLLQWLSLSQLVVGSPQNKNNRPDFNGMTGQKRRAMSIRRALSGRKPDESGS